MRKSKSSKSAMRTMDHVGDAFPTDNGEMRYPVQRLTRGQKKRMYGSEKDWCMFSAFYYKNKAFDDTLYNRAEIEENIRLGFGKIIGNEYDRLVKPYEEDAADAAWPSVRRRKHPVRPDYFDRITQKIQLLLSEEIKRPFKWTILDMSSDGTNELLEKRTEMCVNVIKKMIRDSLPPEQQQVLDAYDQPGEVPEGVNTPQDVDLFFKDKYVSARETIATRLLKYLSQKYNFDYEFLEAHRYQFVTGAEILKVYSDGEPRIRVVNPYNFDCQLTNGKWFVDEAMWAVEREELTMADFVDRYWDQLTDEDFEKMASAQFYGTSDTTYVSTVGYDAAGFRNYARSAGFSITVYHVEWKSLKKIGVRKTIDENGVENLEILDELKWEEEKREAKRQKKLKEAEEKAAAEAAKLAAQQQQAPQGPQPFDQPAQPQPQPEVPAEPALPDNAEETMVDLTGTRKFKPSEDEDALPFEEEDGEEDEPEPFYVKLAEDELEPGKIYWRWINQVYKATITGTGKDTCVIVDWGPVDQHMSVVNPSKCRLSYTGIIKPISLVGQIKPLQHVYNEMMFKLRQLFNKAQGRLGMIDIALFPKEEDGSPWDVTKVMTYARELGFMFVNSAEASEGSRVALQNFQTTIDLSFGQEIRVLMDILDMIDKTMSLISGIAPQREGKTYASETLGGNNQAIQYSNSITDTTVYLHNLVKVRALEIILEKAKHIYQDGNILRYVMSDSEREFLELDDEIFNGEYGLFVTNAPREADIRQLIEQEGMKLVQTGMISLGDMIKVLHSNSLTESVKILEEAQQKNQQQMQQNQQQELQNQQRLQQQQADAQKEVETMRTQLAQQKMQLDDVMNQRDNDTKIQVARINQGAKLEQPPKEPDEAPTIADPEAQKKSEIGSQSPAKDIQKGTEQIQETPPQNP